MTPRIARFSLLIAALTLAGCASTTWKSYPGGSVKFSEISYNYTAKPILANPEGKTYQLEAQEPFNAITSVPALEKRGVRRAPSGGDIVFAIKSGAMRHEPGGFGLGSSYKPAQTSTLSIDIKAKNKLGQVLVDTQRDHVEMLVMNSAKEFKTREEAKAAMTQITELAKSSAESKLKQSAPQTASKSLDSIANSLFEPRKISVTLPAMRSAGAVDMEAAYTLLSNAEGDEQVQSAMAAYAALGTENKNPDGSADVVGNYGVLCGLASSRVLLGDLTGAWQETKKAWVVMPEGAEHRKIAQVLHRQQQEAGVEIIPKEDFDEMVNSDKKKAREQLRKLFGGGT